MLRDDIERYVALYRATGLKFNKQANDLRRFAAFAATRDEEVVRIGTALDWAAQAPSRAQRVWLLGVLRRFASTMKAEEPQHEIPPAAAFGRARPPRRKPHIFTSEELRQLLTAAAALRPAGSLRPLTYATLFALLAATGLRIGEALALKLGDLTPSGLLIRDGKFGKSRLVPLHESVRDGLRRYVAQRTRRECGHESFFASYFGTPLSYPTVVWVFLHLVRSLGLHPGPGCPGPRIHDLRHTFVVRSLEQCAAGRAAVERHMLALSTYIGHAHVEDTYWYLEATPVLLADIATAGEALHVGGTP
ncbi:MAG: tyrosine-type recombinase/integrase [Candidatus Kerfeldbacteria bacterium]